ncbi:MAG: TetR/AcrR family transcriptional regulator [Planctomycetota bacterium]
MNENQTKSVGRPRAFDEREVLQLAMQSFWRRGYEATTLDHLLEDTQLSKSSLYNAFGDKKQLFTKALELYIAQDKFLERLGAEETGAEFLVNILRSYATPPGKRSKGCMMMKTILENAATSGRPKNLPFVTAYLTKVWGAFAAAVRLVKPRRKASLEPEEKAAIILAANFGVAVIGRNGSNPELLESISKALEKLAQTR